MLFVKYFVGFPFLESPLSICCSFSHCVWVCGRLAPPLAQGGSGPLQSGGHAPLAVTSLTQAEYGRNPHVAGAQAYSHGAQQVMSLSALAKTANVLPKVVEYNHMNAKEWLYSVSHL